VIHFTSFTATGSRKYIQIALEDLNDFVNSQKLNVINYTFNSKFQIKRNFWKPWITDEIHDVQFGVFYED